MRQDWQQLIDQTVRDEALLTAYAWEPFAKGSSNSIFLGRLKVALSKHSVEGDLRKTVVLRINAPAQDTPGVERQREADILNLIKSHCWAPQIIRNEPEQGWCLMHHYDSIQTQPDAPTHLPYEYQLQLLAAIDELQAVSVSADNLAIDYQYLLDETYLPLAVKRHDTLAQTRIQSIKNDLAALPALPACLVHHDIHLGNLVRSKSAEIAESNTNLTIVDWEYAAIGNPWFDASCLSRYLSVPAERIHELALFNSLDQEAFRSGVQLADRMTETLQKLWYWARE